MEYFKEVWNYLVLSSPYLLSGLIFAGIIHTFIPVEKIKQHIGANTIGHIIKAAFIGIPLPLCSCAVIPTAVQLRKSGVSNGATSSFLISTPETGVDSIFMTYALMDFPMCLFRIVAAFFSAIIIGLLHFFFNDFSLEKSSDETKDHCATIPNIQTVGQRLNTAIRYGFGDLIDDMALWLLIGIILGAAINWLVPPDFFLNFGYNLSRIGILLVGIPLYICASATTPIAMSLIIKGMTPGTAIILLLVGPATNISNIVILQKYIGKKGAVINIIGLIGVSLAFSYIVDYYYFNLSSPTQFKMQQHTHSEEISLFSVISSILLLILIIKGIYRENIRPILSKNKSCH